ncbi:MAG TPA: hypothetical protein VHE35_01125 [Kofleriaceae bacterium]|nr:hypothetical protein [Kofleriaceae bacterium]
MYLYDNSGDGVDARLCARTSGGLLRKVHAELPRWIERDVDGLPVHPEPVDLRA